MASIIDVLILLVVIAPIEILFFGTDYFRQAMEGKTIAVDVWVQLVLPVVLVILFWRYARATPGLMAIGAKIVDANTLAPVAIARLIVRGLVLLALAVFVVPLVVLLWIPFDKKKQGLHDKISRTVVIYDQN